MRRQKNIISAISIILSLAITFSIYINSYPRVLSLYVRDSHSCLLVSFLFTCGLVVLFVVISYANQFVFFKVFGMMALTRPAYSDPNSSVSAPISGENSETEQVDTKKSIDEPVEKR